MDVEQTCKNLACGGAVTDRHQFQTMHLRLLCELLNTIDATSSTGSTELVVVNLTDAETIAVDVSTFDIGKVTLEGNRTLGAPTGSPVDGQLFQLYVQQDGNGNRTLAYTSGAGGYIFSTDLPEPTLSTDPDQIDVLMFQYHQGLDRWLLLAQNLGFN